MLDTNDEELIRGYVRTAEHYFATIERPEALFDKPWVPRMEAPFALARLSGVLHHLRLGPYMRVIDFGAGMGWLSGVLVRMGCRTIALDVSPSALRQAERALAPLAPPSGPPRAEFRLFDGFSFPVPDDSVDRVVCFDALHHVPNKSRVLAEMFRVLRSGGIVVFAEPGPGHADADESRREADRHGVLEDEVAPRALCRIAQALGFSSSYLVPVGEPGGVTWPSHGDELASASFDDLTCPTREVLIVLQKGDARPDSRAPSRLAAEVRAVDTPAEVRPGEVFQATVRVTNTGDTRWLAFRPSLTPEPLDYRTAFLDAPVVPGEPVSTVGVEVYRRYIEYHALEGTVTLGAQLLTTDGAMIARDFGRGFFDGDVAPGERADVQVRVVAPLTPGLYALVFDPVDEYIAWFGDQGSAVGRSYVRVVGSALAVDSRRPGVLAARIEQVGPVARHHVTVALTNTGDTWWLAGPLAGGGDVHVGLQALDTDGRVANRNWRRIMLPHGVAPGASVRTVLDLRQEYENGIPGVRVDLVNEGFAWFEDVRGSTPIVIGALHR